MASRKNDSLTKIGFKPLEKSEDGQVAIAENAGKVFDKFEVRKRARLKAIMQRWCKGGGLTENMMNTNEGRTKRNNEMLQAFKAFGVRLYGIATTFSGLRTFFIVDADPAKKQDKADPRILDRAKKRADDLADELRRKETNNGPK